MNKSKCIPSAENIMANRDLIEIINRIALIADKYEQPLAYELIEFVDNTFWNIAPECVNDTKYWIVLHNILIKYIGKNYPKDGWKRQIIDIYVGND